MTLTTRNQFFILAASLAVMVVVVWFSAAQSDIVRSQCIQARQQLNEYRSMIWEYKGSDSDHLERRLREELLRFPDQNSIAPLIGEITELAKKKNLEFSSITPRDLSAPIQDAALAKLPLKQLPIDIQLRGKFQDVIEFISTFEKMKNGVLLIGKLDLLKSAPDSEKLSLSLTTDLFVKENSKQDMTLPASIFSGSEERKMSASRYYDISRDPFSYKVDPVRESANLEGIIYDPVSPVALVDGAIKRVGDTVDQMKIIEIHRDRIVVEKAGEKFDIKLQRH